MKRITKYVCLILSAVVTVLLFGTDTKAYAAQNQEMNLYGIYVNSNEKGDSHGKKSFSLKYNRKGESHGLILYLQRS